MCFASISPAFLFSCWFPFFHQHQIPTLFYFHLSALSLSGPVPHLFAYLCPTNSGCCYSCCPSPYPACSRHVLSVLSSVLLPIGPRLSLVDTSVDSRCFCCSCLVTASSAFPFPGCSPLLISCPQVPRPSLRHISLPPSVTLVQAVVILVAHHLLQPALPAPAMSSPSSFPITQLPEFTMLIS